MDGENLKQYIKKSGLTMSQIARELETTPQNIQAKLGRKSIKADFVIQVRDAVSRLANRDAVDLSAAISAANINGSHSSNVSQSINNDAALAAENKLLREQNEFLQGQLKTLLAIMEKSKVSMV